MPPAPEAAASLARWAAFCDSAWVASLRVLVDRAEARVRVLENCKRDDYLWVSSHRTALENVRALRQRIVKADLGRDSSSADALSPNNAPPTCSNVRKRVAPGDDHHSESPSAPKGREALKKQQHHAGEPSLWMFPNHSQALSTTTMP